MSVNEYIAKFTQLSHYALHEVDTVEKSRSVSWMAWRRVWPMLWEPMTLRTFKGWWTRLLCQRTVEVWWSASISWCISISQAVALDRVLLHLQLDLCSILFSHSFSWSCRQLDKNFLPHGAKWFSTPIISRPMLLGIRVFQGSKLLHTCCRLNEGVLLVGRRVISLSDALIRAPVLIRLL
jgi:hypothetical protein